MTMSLSVLGRQEAYPEWTTILDLFGRNVRNIPDTIAICFDGKQMTYRDMNRRSNTLASILQTKGLQKGDIIAVLVGNSLELPIAWLAAIKLGAVLVPFDPAWPPERIKQGLDQIGARVLLMTGNARNDIGTRTNVVIARYDELESSDDRIVFERLLPDDLIYGFFTS